MCLSCQKLDRYLSRKGHRFEGDTEPYPIARAPHAARSYPVRLPFRNIHSRLLRPPCIRKSDVKTQVQVHSLNMRPELLNACWLSILCSLLPLSAAVCALKETSASFIDEHQGVEAYIEDSNIFLPVVPFYTVRSGVSLCMASGVLSLITTTSLLLHRLYGSTVSVSLL